MDDEKETMYYKHTLENREAFFKAMIPAELYEKHKDLFYRFDIEKAEIIKKPMTIEEIKAAGMGKYITPKLIAFKKDNGTCIGK